MDYHKGKGKGNPSFEEDDDGTIDLTLKLGRSDQYNRIEEEAANAMYGQVHNYSSAICQSYNDMGNYSYHQDVYSPSVSATPTRKRPNPNSIKICKGCGSNDTPLWRKGPDGPQTLCNACGLRHLRTVKRAG